MSNAKCQMSMSMSMSMSGEISRSCEISEDLVRSQFILLDLSRSREIPKDLMRSQTKLYYNQGKVQKKREKKPNKCYFYVCMCSRKW